MIEYVAIFWLAALVWLVYAPSDAAITIATLLSIVFAAYPLVRRCLSSLR